MSSGIKEALMSNESEPGLVQREMRMKAEYEPKTQTQKLSYLVEECGEVLAAVGKSVRWGLGSVNPELPPEEQETNADWLLRELVDLERAIGFAREAVEMHREGKSGVVYRPETTALVRAEVLSEVRKSAYGPGLELLRAVMRDLDKAESIIKDSDAETAVAVLARDQGAIDD